MCGLNKKKILSKSKTVWAQPWGYVRYAKRSLAAMNRSAWNEKEKPLVVTFRGNILALVLEMGHVWHEQKEQ